MITPEAMLPPEPTMVATQTLVPLNSIHPDTITTWESGFYIASGALFIAAAIMLAIEIQRYRVAIRKFGKATVGNSTARHPAKV